MTTPEQPPQQPTNTAKGRESRDANIGGSLVSFINKNITAYATDVGAPKFDLVPVEKQKDIMLNVARMHAQQEYDRIMELVGVLQRQAESIKRRLEITDAVHAAKYDFQLFHGNIYWLVYDSKKQITRLTFMGPDDYTTGPPPEYQYICRVKWLGDHTWTEVTDGQD